MMPANIPAPQYRYMTTDLISGAVTGDWLPMTVQGFGRQINTTGSFSGSLNLTAGSTAEAASWRAALTPGRSVLWVLLDNVPVWNGIVWDWVPGSAMSGVLGVSASTFDSLFGDRLIQADLTYTSMDVFDVFRGLLTYAVTKDINCAVAGLNVGTGESGQQTTVTFAGSDLLPVSEAWQELLSAYFFEYSFRAGISSSGTLVTYLDIATPELGQQFPASGLAFNLPGNLLDYQWPPTRSSSSNKLIATAQDSTGTGLTWTSAYPHGYDLIDLGQGYPLLETSISLSTIQVSDQAQIDAYADGVLPAYTGTQLMPTLTMGNGQQPDLRNITLGSWCQVALTSPLHPAGPNNTPGFQGQGRITGWTVTPPTASQAEQVQLQLWIPTSAEQAEGSGTELASIEG
jgi:hypothetical protein